MTHSIAEQFSSTPLVDQTALTVADAVWVVTATGQRAAGTNSFSTEELVNAVVQSGLTKGQNKSIWQHVNQHCVANRKAQPNRLRYLFATGGGNRRLWRIGDTWDASRDGAATHPAWERLPLPFADLQKWYEEEWNGRAEQMKRDSLLDLIGSGRHIWAKEHADEYVSRLRADGDDPK